MHKTQWLSQTEFALRRAGMPQDYVNRTCSELLDHVEECEANGQRAMLLEESPRDLAQEIVSSYRSKGLLRRIPPVVLLLLPLPFTVLMTIAYYAAGGVVLETIYGDLQAIEHLPLHVTTLIWVIFYSGKLAGPVLSGWLTLEIVRRMSRPWYWAAGMFLLQSFAIVFTKSDLQMALRQLSLSIGLGPGHVPHASQIMLAAVVALVGLAVVSRQRQCQLGIAE